MAAADAATKPLVVFIVFFGELPLWLPLTLTSMAMNARVQFVVVGDAAPPPIPQNVRFEQISYPAMQSRLAKLIEADVRYNWTYKGNDIKPAAPALYPHLVAGYEWWAWADLDVVFGDLLRFMDLAARRPACCKVPLRRDGTPKSKRLVNVYHHRDACPCTNGESINVVCPLYPNPWSKKAWGPFTAFRVGFGSSSSVNRRSGAPSSARMSTPTLTSGGALPLLPRLGDDGRRADAARRGRGLRRDVEAEDAVRRGEVVPRRRLHVLPVRRAPPAPRARRAAPRRQRARGDAPPPRRIEARVVGEGRVAAAVGARRRRRRRRLHAGARPRPPQRLVRHRVLGARAHSPTGRRRAPSSARRGSGATASRPSGRGTSSTTRRPS